MSDNITRTSPTIKEYMYESLMILMRHNELDKITISDIVNKAGVSRMAYYRNYKSKESIIETHMHYILAKISRDFERKKVKTPEVFFEIFFAYMQRERELFINIQCTSLVFSLYDIIARDCVKLFTDNFPEYAKSKYLRTCLSATIGACIAVLYEWSKDSDYEIEDYTLIIKDLVNGFKSKNR